MNRNFLITAAVFGCTAVMFGAFAAHQLKAQIDAYQLDIWQKAVDYQFYHTFALLAVALLSTSKNKWNTWAYYAFTVGIILFSGSLYLLALKDVLSISFSAILGPITPIGGLLFILGWFFILMFAAQKKS